MKNDKLLIMIGKGKKARSIVIPKDEEKQEKKKVKKYYPKINKA